MSAGRRGNGEGTIFQRKDGRWTAGAEVGGYRRKWIYGKTRREVADRLTTFAMRALHCCWSKVCIRGWSWKRSAIVRSA